MRVSEASPSLIYSLILRRSHWHVCLTATIHPYSHYSLSAAQMIGLAQGAFSASVPYTYQRKQFGKPVGEFQVRLLC